MNNTVIVSEPKYEEQTKSYVLKEIGFGEFCEWGCNYEEFENGPGNYSTAIVKMADGSIKNVPVEHIRFINPGVVKC
jgi:hypothetical protein